MELQSDIIRRMTLPKELTTITPLSKYLAMFLFIVLPFLGFFVGLRYEQQFTQYMEDRTSLDQYTIKPSSANKQNASTANWKTYRNEEFGFEIKYPNDFQKDSEKNNYIKVYKPSFASLSISSISTGKNLEEYVDELIAATKEAYEGKSSLGVSKRIRNTVAGKPSIQLKVFYEAAGTYHEFRT